MDDLVDRLRGKQGPAWKNLEAADEIERLREIEADALIRMDERLVMIDELREQVKRLTEERNVFRNLFNEEDAKHRDQASSPVKSP